MHPKDLSINEFQYDLPEDKIAFFPLEERDTSKLLVYQNGNIKEDIYKNIADHLPENSLLVFNDTRVIKARVMFEKSTGSTIEIFCLEPYGRFSDYEFVFHQQQSSTWKCFIGKAGKWKEKQLVKIFFIGEEEVTLSASLTEQLEDAYVVQFDWQPGHFSFAEIVDHAGVTPLPPYIRRKAVIGDEEKYQTIYSSHEGSVAAPTAGLHFTKNIFTSFSKKNIQTAFTTLHVGAGTFKPVKAEKMEGHHMHAEWMELSLDFLQILLESAEKKIICVGTTSMRTVESIYHMGNKILNNPGIDVETLKISQWEVYEPQQFYSAKESLKVLIQFLEKQKLSQLFIQTEIIIAPGYTFRLAQGLVTNFHQPKSTLLLLVAALAGKDWKEIYNYALQHDFRFLSYGDGCLILP